jgi:hypothetical protein
MCAAVLLGTRHPGEWLALSLARPRQLTRTYQPDGYLTEERKAADPDQGFSTFFSETGTLFTFVD